jgi:hypothetical protein
MTGHAPLRRPAPTTVTPAAGRRVQAAEPAGPMVAPDKPMVAPGGCCFPGTGGWAA